MSDGARGVECAIRRVVETGTPGRWVAGDAEVMVSDDDVYLIHSHTDPYAAAEIRVAPCDDEVVTRVVVGSARVARWLAQRLMAYADLCERESTA